MKTKNFNNRAWIEINHANLEHNVREVQRLMPENCELMAVVKADAYGLGAYTVAKHLYKIGIRAFAVATIDEGIRLRKAGIRGDILILGYTDPERIREIRRYRFTQTAVDHAHAEALNRKRVSIDVHLKIDTGMHRLGIPFDSVEDVQSVFRMKNLRVTGIFSHFACADSREIADVTFTNLQILRFRSLIQELKDCGISVPKAHIQSSYGLLNYPELQFDYVRCGVALYGVLSSSADKTVLSPDLKPVLTVKSRITHIQAVRKGDPVGYGRTCILQRNSLLATVSIGYGDGIPRVLSNAGQVLIHDQHVPIVGRLCMDQLIIDVTDADHVKVGDAVTIIDARKGSPASAERTAETANTITNEILSRLGSRLKNC